MNKDRRKTLEEVKVGLEKLQQELTNIDLAGPNYVLQAAKEDAEAVMNEEQEAFDNLSEGLQQAERGQCMEEVVSVLDDVMSEIDEAIEKMMQFASINETLSNAIGKIEEALE